MPGWETRATVEAYRGGVNTVPALRPSTAPWTRGHVTRRVVIGSALVVLLAGAIGVAIQPGFAARVTAVEAGIQQKVGVELAAAGIYLEESGVPMPVPSEVSVGYLGRRLNANPLALVATWMGLTLLIVLGSTNLFAASRRFGPAIVSGRLGAALHLTPAAIARAHWWFQRWGPLAIAVARYVPGLRWGMAVACGIVGVSYRTFWLSTAISAAVWAGGLVTLGITVGDSVGRMIAGHAWIGLLLPLPAAAAVATGLMRLALDRRSSASTNGPGHISRLGGA